MKRINRKESIKEEWQREQEIHVENKMANVNVNH